MLWWSNRRLVASLEEQVRWLRSQLLIERRRAEDATNLVLAKHEAPGTLTVTAPPAPVDDVVQRLMRDTEFSSVGSME